MAEFRPSFSEIDLTHLYYPEDIRRQIDVIGSMRAPTEEAILRAESYLQDLINLYSCRAQQTVFVGRLVIAGVDTIAIKQPEGPVAIEFPPSYGNEVDICCGDADTEVTGIAVNHGRSALSIPVPYDGHVMHVVSPIMFAPDGLRVGILPHLN